jgi:hypothetical protein
MLEVDVEPDGAADKTVAGFLGLHSQRHAVVATEPETNRNRLLPARGRRLA